jgi:hypothetical protein
MALRFLFCAIRILMMMEFVFPPLCFFDFPSLPVPLFALDLVDPVYSSGLWSWLMMPSWVWLRSICFFFLHFLRYVMALHARPLPNFPEAMQSNQASTDRLQHIPLLAA